MDNRSVLFARFQGPLFVKGVGQFGPEVSPVTKGGGKIKELTMSWGPSTLDININGRIVGVPHANIQCVEFEK